jgi:hypothetical protein
VAVTAPDCAGNPKVQIMPRSRKVNTAKAGAPARKAARKTVKQTKPPRPAVKETSSRASKARSRGTPARASKKSAMLALLQRSKGAAISDLIAATGWQAHSVRAALTGLRKKGKELARDKDPAGVTHYRLAAEA